MSMFMVFDSMESAQAGLDIINSRMGFPIIGVNAKTGEPEPAAELTVRWAEIWPTETGQFVFPAPLESLQEGIMGFTLEELNPAWFPLESEEINGA